MNKTRGIWRGKRIDNGEWYQGIDVMHKTVRGEVCLCNPYEDWVSVVTSTLGEFTGLTDKNGKFVFEGDIIRYKKHLFCIEWSADICSFTSRALDGENFMPCVNVGTVKNCEVISNIHDNSELLPAHGEDGESNAR